MVVSHSGSDWLICYPVWTQRKVQGLYVPGASESLCYISQWPHQPQGFPGGSDGKEFTCHEGDLDLIPGWEDPLEEGMTTHSSILAWRIPMDRGAWRATVHGVAKRHK